MSTDALPPATENEAPGTAVKAPPPKPDADPPSEKALAAAAAGAQLDWTEPPAALPRLTDENGPIPAKVGMKVALKIGGMWRVDKVVGIRKGARAIDLEHHRDNRGRNGFVVQYPCKAGRKILIISKSESKTAQLEALERREERVRKEEGHAVLPPETKARVQRESIVRDMLSIEDETEVELPGGWIADAVNKTSGWFTEYKKLDKHLSLTARGQIETYRARLKQMFRRSFRSRIVFFSEENEVDARKLFEEILDDYKLEPFGLTQAVLVHMSNIDVAAHKAALKELERTTMTM